MTLDKPQPRREIRFMDTTLRDGHQCLWATRMTTAMMLPIAEKLDRAGFEVIDLMSGVQFDVAIRHLKENPWNRIRLMRERTTRTPLQANLRSKSVLSFDVLPNDINALWIERLVANGIRSVRAFDALNDMDNIVDSLRLAKKLGARAVGAVVFSESPVHTDAMYVCKAKELIERAGVDAIMLKDASGLLTPDRVRTLVPALKQVCGTIPLEFHSHALTGLAPLLYLEAARLGADQLHTCIAPLANGAAQPAVQTIARNLRAEGYVVNLDDALISDISMHFHAVARQEGMPLGTPAEYDAFHYQHQIPGGMLSNMRAQLEQAGLAHKLQEVLAECARVRAELGWPAMVTPFSQLVGTQAVLNVVQGERYRTVPDEVKKYALGYYGKLLAPVDPDVLDRIVSGGSPKIALAPPPVEAGVPGLRRRYPRASDEERLLRYMYAGSQVDDMLAAGPTRTEYRNASSNQPNHESTYGGKRHMTLTHEDVRKILEILDHSDCEEVYLEFGDLKVHLRKHGDSADPENPADRQAPPQPGHTVNGESAAPVAPAPRGPGQEATIPEGVIAVTAPMLGTFYRAPTPGARPFVEVGDKVQPDDTVCLVEVMKLFNSVRAGTAGTIERIFVENAALVEYGQPLILIRKDNT